MDYKCVPILCDNTSSINLTTNTVQHSRTKHIEIKHHFITDHIAKGNISLDFVCFEDQIMNIFTKLLAEKKLTILEEVWVLKVSMTNVCIKCA